MKVKHKRIYNYVGITAITILALVIAILQFWPRALLKQPLQGIGGVSTFNTDSGLKVMYLYAPEVAMIDLRLMVDAGSVQDGQRPGVASLTSALLDRGTEDHDSEAFADKIAAIGAIISQSTYKDHASVSLRTLTKRPNMEIALGLFFEMLRAPTFDEQSFELRQAQQLAAIKFNKQRPAKIAIGAFNRLLYQDHPYARSINGTTESVQALTTKDVHAFFANHYGINQAVLAIVGNVDEHTAREIGGEIGGILAKRNHQEPQRSKPLPTKAASKTIDFPSTQTHIYYGALGVKRGDADYFPLYVGNHILGGGMISKLYQEIREQKGLAYSVYSYFAPRRELGPFIIGMQTRNQESERALASAKDILRDFVTSGPTEQELVAAKKYITGNFPLRVSSNSDMVGYLAMIGYYNLPINYLLEFNNNIENVTVEAIKSAFKRRIDPENMITVTVGQASGS